MGMGDIIITISGFHGVGKSTLARYISEKYGLRRVSSGEIFRRLAREKGYTLEEFSRIAEKEEWVDRLIDNTVVEECRRGGCVADGLLTGFFLRDVASLKIWLKCPLEIRVRRIAEREGRPIEEVYRETLAREESEVKRFREMYGIDVTDLSIYDLVIDTSRISLEGLYRIVDAALMDILDRVGRDG